jgi:copper chaperone CopZ
MRTAQLEIRGMHCDGCAARVRTLLEREPGVRAVDVSFAEGCARVRHNEHVVEVGRLVQLVETAGFEVKGRS